MKKKIPLISSAFLIFANCLGIGVLALPIKASFAGLLPTVLGIFIIWSAMLSSAWIIVYRIRPEKKNFDIPSFYNQEIGQIGKWFAIILNLILLYSIIIAYVTGISTMLEGLVPDFLKYDKIITCMYFLFVCFLILLGIKIFSKVNIIFITLLLICFAFIVFIGINDFNPYTLQYKQWILFPFVLPFVISAFTFHNLIPTISNQLKHNVAEIKKAIFIGIFLALVTNIIWLFVVLSFLPKTGLESDNVTYANFCNLATNVPMSVILTSGSFKVFGLVFAILSVTVACLANATGLYGFMRDLTTTYFKSDSRWLVGFLAFLPPLILSLIYPNFFLYTIEIAGGIGEAILFIIIPAFILIRITSQRSFILVLGGYLMMVIGIFVLIYSISEKLGLVNLAF